MAVPTLDNLADETQLRGPGVRSIIATAGEGYSPLPLIPGTEKYAHNWMRQWHMSQQSPEVSDVACYIDVDTVVSGDGLIWIEDHLVTSPEVMPPYVATGLALETGGCARLHNDRTLSIRTVSEPCLVAVGHGTQVYGHFLIEMLFRILVAAEALKETHSRYRILLDRKAPPWLIYILNCILGIRLEDMEFFNPEVERVHLPRGIISGRVHQNSGFHPIANTLLDRLISSLPTSSTQYPSRRFFILRNRFMNPHAPQRICKNEQKLAEIALKEHDFTPITIEDLDWHEQIQVFRNAEIVLGQAGSGLHNTIFSSPGSKLATLGIMNLTQSRISSLRQQHMAYLMEGINLQGEFSINETRFAEFLGQVCLGH